MCAPCRIAEHRLNIAAYNETNLVEGLTTHIALEVDDVVAVLAISYDMSDIELLTGRRLRTCDREQPAGRRAHDQSGRQRW